MSTIASWGIPEDRPEREAMRALLIGRRFMDAYRAARGDPKKHEQLGWWFGWVRENTAPELQWMWSSDRAYKDEHADVYAQVAGDLILQGVADAAVVSPRWFKTDISEQYGWLFEPACLEYDSWKLVDITTTDDREVKSWTRQTDSR